MFDRNIRDTELEKTGALPNGAATTYSSVIDLGAAGVSQLALEKVDVEIAVPALTTSEAPDTRTLTVTLCQGATSTPTTEVSAATVLTGAGGAGTAKTVIRLKAHPANGRYLRAKFVGGTSFGNASGKNGTLALVF